MGRPNVGKSTLFNRLVRWRKALVNPAPGLTRDLREQSCKIAGQYVTLIDSAGLEDSRTGIKVQMTGQALKAADKADVVLFVVDAQSGILPADEEWTQHLRKKAKNIILVANKCESPKKSEGGRLDALRLGLGEPVEISAEHDLGIGDLEKQIAQLLAAQEQGEQEEAEGEVEKSNPSSGTFSGTFSGTLKIAIIGRPNAGKSSLINRLVGERRQLTSAEPGTTRDAISIPWNWGSQWRVLGKRESSNQAEGGQTEGGQTEIVELFDTAGLRRKAKIVSDAESLSVSSALQAMRFADIVVLLMDAEHPFENQDLRLADLIVREGRAPVIAINKIDLTPALKKKEIVKRAYEVLPQMKGVEVVCLSAKTGEGVSNLVPQLIRARNVWNSKINTAALNQWLQKCVARHPPPAVKQVGRRRAVRIKYITQKSTRPPSFIIFTSRTKKLPHSYKQFLINDMRSSFGLGGTPIRLDVRASVNPYI